MSKKHPGMSSAYKKKQTTRDKRAPHRLYLNKAKELFKSKSNQDPKKNRMKITEMKKQLMIADGYDPTCKPTLCWFFSEL